jgi:transposase
MDLRARVMRSLKKGGKQTWVAPEWGIGLGTLKGYIKLAQRTGRLEPKRQQRQQAQIGDEALRAWQAQADSHAEATLEEHIGYWESSPGVRVGQATMCRALQGADRPLKKTVRAQEGDEGQRGLFQDLASSVELKRLVVIEESRTKIGLRPAYARPPAGQRADSNAPFNPGRNYSLLAGLRPSRMTAPFVLEGATDRAVFESYLQAILCPTLPPGDRVIRDKGPFHKAASIAALIAQGAAAILWLPAYAPDLAPLQQAFTKLNQVIPRAKATPYAALRLAMERALQAITLSDALPWFINSAFFNLDQAT